MDIANDLQDDVTNAATKAATGAIDSSKLPSSVKDAAHGVMRNM